MDGSDSNSKEKEKSFTKKAIDASKILVGSIAIKAVDEISRIVVDYPKKPKEVSRREFTKSKPTKTFTKAARAVKYWGEHPDQFTKDKGKMDNFQVNKGFSPRRSEQSYSVIPGLDGLVSFSILLVPFAIFLGIINQIFINNLFIDILLWIFLFIYVLFVALPGAYLGLDAIKDGTRALLVNSGATIKFGIKGIFYFFKIFFQGVFELFALFFNTFFENVIDYWVFISSYLVSLIILFFTLNIIFTDISLFTFLMLVIIPALLPAAILHRYWILFRYKRRTKSF